MTNSRRAAGVLVAATAALALAACGSSSDTLSKSDLAAKANAICKTYNDKGRAIAKPTANDPAQIAAYWTAAAKLVEEQQAKLRALKPADDVKADWNAYLALNDQGIADVPAVIAAANAKDAAAYSAASAKLKALSAKINPAADALGATTCGSKSSQS